MSDTRLDLQAGARTDPAHHHGHTHAHPEDHIPAPVIDRSAIQGWGADLDPKDRPAVPMERTPPRLDFRPGEPEQQAQTVEILQSTERPRITPVFGTTVPPSGVSGSMRRLAFRFSENDLRRWMLLLAADRVNVVEGVVDDLRHGHVPNIYAEMGGRAELKHNPAGAAKKAAVLAGVLAVGYLLWRRGRDR
ncbi:MAG: hypothetical protein MK041_00400 [Aquabacterium sp.]|nr:hypothetical protein [Aquabacterium sp.]